LLLLGYDILEATDGRTGIEMSLTESLDLLFMDVSLPDSAGFDTARRIKENFKTSQIPIVACSGYQDQELTREALESGIVEFIDMPISPKELVEVIEKLT
jgi:CheY-like chemotaxis protein